MNRRPTGAAWRPILITTTVIATLAAAALAVFIHPIDEQRTVHSLRALGYEVRVEKSEHRIPILGRIERVILDGDRPFDETAVTLLTRFSRLKMLVIRCGTIVPGTLRRLGELPSLSYLEIDGHDVDDHSLEGMGSAVALETLWIQGTAIRGPGLAEVLSMTGLSHLTLDDNARLSDFTGIDLRHRKMVSFSLRGSAIAADSLGWLPNCERLFLDNTAVDDDSLSALASCTRLEDLSLQRTRVTGEGLKAIASLPALRELNLTGCLIRDESLEHVVPLKALRWLKLSETPISDRGLDRLNRATQLDWIPLDGCPGVTADGVERLRRALNSGRPKGTTECRIEADTPVGGSP